MGTEKGTDKGLARLVQGFTELVGKLEEAAQTGQAISKTGTVDVGGRKLKPGKGVFGFSVQVGGLGGSEPKIEPFGNIRHDADTGDPRLEETREPLIDAFDEEDRLLIVAEMPGVDAEDVEVDLEDRTLILSAQRDERKYRKEIEAPEGIRKEAIRVSGKNGIVEISCVKQ